MMMNKRLISAVDESKKYIAGNVAVQWIAMLCNAALIFAIGGLLGNLASGKLTAGGLISAACVAAGAAVVRFFCMQLQSFFSYYASKTVKKKLRRMIFRKLSALGSSYKEQVSTAEITQLTTEGVDQLETYFGGYLPQFFYAILAPLTLFVILCFVSVRAAIILLICVPLIPVCIVLVQKAAKKLLGKYWGQYTTMGDTFLENLQGLTTLKIYRADAHMNRRMNAEAEKFRRVTMKVLTMQLNSVTIMDLIAYGGAAVGVILAGLDLAGGRIGISGCFAIIMLAAEFFIPMRRLGSYFHVAMNGMAASDKIFALLDLPEPEEKTEAAEPEHCTVKISGLAYSYGGERQVLDKVSLTVPEHSFIAVVGESGSGKSTLAGVLTGRCSGYEGSVKLGGKEISTVTGDSLMQCITYVSDHSHLFKGTVRDNLLMGNPDAVDRELWAVLERTGLADLVGSRKGLNTELTEGASNLSGGQRQRLALARALLHDTPVYIFDEVTSNIDVESETAVMEQIHALAGKKTVILITHRLANAVPADRILVMDKGQLAEQGTHDALMEQDGLYARLFRTQQALEQVGRGDDNA